MSRTRKQPYTKGKRFDATCRNHGACPWCARNRLHSSFRRAGVDKHRRNLRSLERRHIKHELKETLVFDE